MILGRRLLCLGALAGLGASLPEANAPISPTLRRFVKMRGALDGRLVLGCVRGLYSGVVDGRVTPLFGVVSAVFSLYRPRAGGFEVAGFEQAYYTDRETGQVLDRWKNPYTGEAVRVPVYSEVPSTLFFGSDLVFHSPAPARAGVQVAQFARGPEMIGPDMVFVEQVSVSVAGAGGAPPFTYRDNTVLRAKASEVDRPDTLATPSKTTFDAVVSWRPWLNMGTRPGHMEALGYGGFGVSFADLPAEWVTATERVRPGLLKHPELLLAAAWKAVR